MNRLDIRNLVAGFNKCKSLGQEMALADAEIIECETEIRRLKRERKKDKLDNASRLSERQHRDGNTEVALGATDGPSGVGPDGVLDIELPSG